MVRIVMIEVANRRRSPSSIAAAHPDATILDVTSRGVEPWVRLSPFYPHGGIPVPFTPGVTSASVEGIWQALKVFSDADVDPAILAVTSMKGLKRTNGPTHAHRAGLHSDRMLDYETARRQIYLPSFHWVLTHRVATLLADLRHLASTRGVVLLDYTTNGDVSDLSTPLSHAALIARYLTNQ